MRDSKKKRILIVDDDEQVVALLKKFIETTGYTTLTSVSSEQGLALARRNDVYLILLDIALPEIDGVTFLKKIRNISPNIQVIMITGHDDIKLAKYCLEIGASDYITKPFDLDYLKTSVLASIITK